MPKQKIKQFLGSLFKPFSNPALLVKNRFSLQNSQNLNRPEQHQTNNSQTHQNQSQQLHEPVLQRFTELSQEIQELKKNLIQQQIFSKWSLHDGLMTQLASTQEPPTNCPLCNQNLKGTSLQVFESHCIFGGGDLLRYQCPHCDVIFGPTKILHLSPKALSREYFWHYQAYSEGDSTQLELRAFYAMKPKRNGLYLNWGAGRWSNTLQILRAEGWNVLGYDPFSPPSTDTDLYIQDENQLSNHNFDGIFSNNVLEHLQDPIADILKMKAILKDEGSMVHATPCFEYMYEYTRFHVFFFLGRSRQLLAEQAAMELKEHYRDGIFMYIMLQKKYS
ncbi:class I SAM-dependent methyltransferase [Leptothoe sp. PORK10 BA2]|uniref:class I SAM-dependent methyltransferase n=1 Tax=Leptothoe sp. PORK10 BA2 TaxID=3110254 RepID=UPI002B21DB3F|nr:methyltransferase domain-containing protein [Leptothoe sp. PORK10 BA2]MEA5462706.1 methyltransferase domain-containing protein [Leptothoe sp. PORK10 BA2]